MFKLYFTVLLFFSCLFATGHSFAIAKKPPAKLKKDTLAIVTKKFDDKALNRYRSDKEFNYKGPDINTPSAWDRFWAWFWNTLFSKIGGGPVIGGIIKYTFLALAIGSLIYFIFKITGMDALKLWQGDSRKASLPYTESLENIHEINFDAEIEKAIASHNYRLAVRLQYLKCLKQLSDDDLIKWQIDKTNSAYAYELADPSHRQAFLILTRQFEYIWYGGFIVDGDAFKNISRLFQNFKKQLV